jgi:C_GCAxxG_C_C family probable redox protein
VLAVGEHLWGDVDDTIRRMTTGLGGGVGGSQQELCGTVSGGALLIGALYGRASVDEDEEECYRRVCLYRDRFIAHFGTTRCLDLRESGYGSEGKWPCSLLVEQATRMLWEVLSE